MAQPFRQLRTPFIATLFILMTFCGMASAQSNVSWSVEVKPSGASEGDVIVKAHVPKGIHFFAFKNDGGGFNPLTIDIDGNNNVNFGKIKSSLSPKSEYFEEFGQTLAYWENDVTFTIPYKVVGTPGLDYDVKIRFQSCYETTCFAPKKETFSIKLGDKTSTPDVKQSSDKLAINKDDSQTSENKQASDKKEVIETKELILEDNDGNVEIEETLLVKPDTLPADILMPESVDLQSVDNNIIEQWWAPISTDNEEETSSAWMIFILGFLGGLAALLTPCVWPMIPMTLSFFLKKGKDKSKSRRDAFVYGLSIIVIYLVLGIAITLIFGAGKLNELSTNAIFNIFFFLLLVIFAISFFGAFDIKLPAKWSNAIDNKAETTTGFISIFFMAFTLVLVSFSCTGPIIGTLLVEAASQGNLIGPALGMGGFALGLALPFSLFAIFPGMLKEMPKSGGWLNTVKVTLGFIELILSLKFLSVADMAYQWHILDREVFLVLWIVLFALLGFYLLGKIRFAHDDKTEKVGVFRFFLALTSLSFSIYLLPGLWGAPLKAVSAFVPPLETQDFNLYVQREVVEFDDYDQGMAYAFKHDRPVLLDFSGYGCVNCRKMEVEVFDNERVREFIADNFVMIKLMVDERTPLPEPYTVKQNGKELLIESVGEKWTYLESHKFASTSQPYYIILDNYGKAMSAPIFYTNDKNKFMEWLERGLQKYQSK